jgi:hypothetical protein
MLNEHYFHFYDYAFIIMLLLFEHFLVEIVVVISFIYISNYDADDDYVAKMPKEKLLKVN